MSVTFELRDELERKLRAEVKDLDQWAREATLVVLYRQGRITHRDLSQALGLTRLETEAVLKLHNVTEDFAERGRASAGDRDDAGPLARAFAAWVEGGGLKERRAAVSRM